MLLVVRKKRTRCCMPRPRLQPGADSTLTPLPGRAGANLTLQSLNVSWSEITDEEGAGNTRDNIALRTWASLHRLLVVVIVPMSMFTAVIVIVVVPILVVAIGMAVLMFFTDLLPASPISATVAPSAGPLVIVRPGPERARGR